MSGELFVVGISWRTAPVAVREKLAFREEELEGTLQKITAQLPVAEALLISTCNRVEVYGVGKPGTQPTSDVRAFLAETGNPFERIALDADGRASIEWGVYGVPETFVIDGRGIVRARIVGEITQDVLRNQLLPAIRDARG